MLKLIRKMVRCGLSGIHSEDIIINTDEVLTIENEYALVTIKLKNGESIKIPFSTSLLVKPFMEFMVSQETMFKTYNPHSIKMQIASVYENYSRIEPVYTEGFDGFRKSLPEMTLEHVIWYYKLLKDEGFVEWELPVLLEKSEDEGLKDNQFLKSIHKFSSEIRRQNLYYDIKNKFNNIDGLRYDLDILGEREVLEKVNKTYKNEVKEIIDKMYSEVSI